MTSHSTPELLALHAVRLLGFADTPEVAERFSLDEAAAAQTLAQAQRHGWVQYTDFAGLAGWSLTEEGKLRNELQLAMERQEVDLHDVVGSVYREFMGLNGRLLRACTDWQLRPTAGDALAANDHTDLGWDGAVLAELAALSTALMPLAARLGQVLSRFDEYGSRFARAQQLARSGLHEWVDGSSIDSCHRVWFQLHEDLLATLGLERGAGN